MNDLTFLLKAVAENPISGTDSSCAFCQAYGEEEEHSQHEVDGEERECPVVIARKLLAERDKVNQGRVEDGHGSRSVRPVRCND